MAGTTLYQFFFYGVPEAEVMSAIGILALVANLVSVWMLMAHRTATPMCARVWLCSRNDAIGNVAW